MNAGDEKRLSGIREIPGHFNYGASRDGRIWSSWKDKNWKEKSQFTMHKGYKMVTFHPPDQLKPKSYRVHKLIMITFVGEKPNGFTICHYNGNPADNRLENLRYDTFKNNCADKIRHGTKRYGSQVNLSKLNELQVRTIKIKIKHKPHDLSLNKFLGRLSKKYKVSVSALNHIFYERTWSQVYV